jgi:hypothetical protein
MRPIEPPLPGIQFPARVLEPQFLQAQCTNIRLGRPYWIVFGDVVFDPRWQQQRLVRVGTLFSAPGLKQRAHSRTALKTTQCSLFPVCDFRESTVMAFSLFENLFLHPGAFEETETPNA